MFLFSIISAGSAFMLYNCYVASGEKTYGGISKKYYGKYMGIFVEFAIV